MEAIQPELVKASSSAPVLLKKVSSARGPAVLYKVGDNLLIEDEEVIFVLQVTDNFFAEKKGKASIEMAEK